VAEALEADLGNLHPEDEALIESVVTTGETTQATQDSQQATAAAAPTEATTAATAPAAAAAPKKTRKRGFSYARKKLVATKEVYLK
jgi:3-oxoacyl-ACP reductase-like protein